MPRAKVVRFADGQADALWDPVGLALPTAVTAVLQDAAAPPWRLLQANRRCGPQLRRLIHARNNRICDICVKRAFP